MKRQIIRNGRLITPDGILEHHALRIENGVIAAIIPEPVQPPAGWDVLDADGLFVSPGFVDIHQHGGGGSDYMDEDPDAYYQALSAHLRHGTTSVMPTLLSAAGEHTIRAVRQYVRAAGDPRIRANMLGLHIEGPYISPMQAGAQRPDQIRGFDPKEYHAVWEAAEGHLKRWSVAPELPGAAEFARYARDNGTVLSIAHSDADFDTVLRAFDWGFHHVTHLYSAMSTVKRQNGFRIAGVLEAAYYLDGMNVEIIADGCHLPPSLLRLVTKLKKPERVALITDAMRAAGMHVSASYLGSREEPTPVIIEDGVAKLPDRTAFGGSIATADRLVRTMVKAGGSLESAVQMVTQTPLKMMELDVKKGQLRCGYDADLCLFDEEIRVHSVIVGGEAVETADETLRQKGETEQGR